VDVNLRLYTSGFAPTAAYTIAGTTGGTAAILGDGFTARFTSTGGAGLASFSYTVNDGSVFTDSVQVLVNAQRRINAESDDVGCCANLKWNTKYYHDSFDCVGAVGCGILFYLYRRRRA